MVRRWAAPAIWATMITASSFIPFRGLGAPDVPGADKLVHFVMYFALAVFVNHSARWPCLACGLSVTAGCGALGGLIEVLQQYVPGRVPDVWDALVNVIAAAVGSWVYIHWRLTKPEREAGA